MHALAMVYCCTHFNNCSEVLKVSPEKRLKYAQTWLQVLEKFPGTDAIQEFIEVVIMSHMTGHTPSRGGNKKGIYPSAHSKTH